MLTESIVKVVPVKVTNPGKADVVYTMTGAPVAGLNVKSGTTAVTVG